MNPKKYRSDREILKGPCRATNRPELKRKKSSSKRERNKLNGNRPRSVKGRCGERCLFKCSTITDGQREAIFKQYWALPDLNQKRYFLSCLLKPIVTDKRYLKLDTSGNIIDPRKCNNAYYIRIESKEEVRVCKIFFLRTFDVSERVIRTIVSKKTDLDWTPILPDLRGRHNNQPRLARSDRERVVSFINSKREYIEGSKTIKEIHRDYMKLCTIDNVNAVSYSTFNNIFKNDFKISRPM